jgi:hypothetical protein
MTALDIVAAVTGEHTKNMVTDEQRERPSRDEIARLAFELYEKRGRRDGYEVEDWLAAEQQLRHLYR